MIKYLKETVDRREEWVLGVVLLIVFIMGAAGSMELNKQAMAEVAETCQKKIVAIPVPIPMPRKPKSHEKRFDHKPSGVYSVGY